MKKIFTIVCLFCLWGCGGSGSTSSSEPTGNWSIQYKVDAPTARSSHSAIWTGSEMIIWGGIDKNNQGLNDGKAFNPVTGTWRAISSVNAPSARYSHTSVWTGSKMLIWGGSNSYSQVPMANSGGIYDPSTDSWTLIPAIASPNITSMNLHTAVWTGTHMIVWGGDNGNVGWKYDPAANSWGQISSVNAPSGCIGHTAIWTGAEMMIWGGLDSLAASTYLNSGGKYNPLTDTWSPISTTNAPSARSNHSAIWTGSEMIIWSGQGSVSGNNERLNTGARYNPSTDTWSETALVGAPDASSIHNAVWTGSNMIIFGGFWSSYNNNGSGIYNPLTDTWKPISLQNAPISIFEHSPIWTGSHMIMWGGKDIFTSDLIRNTSIFTL